MSNFITSLIFKRLLALGLLLICSSHAIAETADAAAVRKRFFDNIDAAGIEMQLKRHHVKAEPISLVKNVYYLVKPDGGRAGIVNADGTIFGRGDFYNTIDGNIARRLTPNEQKAFAQKIVADIRYDKLIRMDYGRGGNRKILVYSAVDCSSCAKFEDDLAQSSRAGKLNTSLYVLPIALRSIRDGATTEWGAVAAIHCNGNPAAAWAAYWEGVKARRGYPINRTSCSPKQLDDDRIHLQVILKSVGISLNGTPVLLFEDGTTTHILDGNFRKLRDDAKPALLGNAVARASDNGESSPADTPLPDPVNAINEATGAVGNAVGGFLKGIGDQLMK